MISFSLYVFITFSSSLISSTPHSLRIQTLGEPEKREKEPQLAASDTAETNAAMVLQDIIVTMDTEHL
ncbi:uncharacterized [Tachysurus ichikawai]